MSFDSSFILHRVRNTFIHLSDALLCPFFSREVNAASFLHHHRSPVCFAPSTLGPTIRRVPRLMECGTLIYILHLSSPAKNLVLSSLRSSSRRRLTSSAFCRLLSSRSGEPLYLYAHSSGSLVHASRARYLPYPASPISSESAAVRRRCPAIAHRGHTTGHTAWDPW